MIPNTRFAKVELLASSFLMRSCHPKRYFVDIVTARKVLAGSRRLTREEGVDRCIKLIASMQKIELQEKDISQKAASKLFDE